uniref:(northern house mosquito) hypothetical protein n=1 Tax=Culex pipiens TaxID=7175 RepID=A0A8D7ZXB6_CULPI
MTRQQVLDNFIVSLAQLQELITLVDRRLASHTDIRWSNGHVFIDLHTGAGKYLVGQRFIARMDKDRFNVLRTHQTQAANVAELRGRPRAGFGRFLRQVATAA